MAISSIKLKDFTVFKNLDIKFSEGINIIIGENGTGKTHLLKQLYSGLVANNPEAFFDFSFMSISPNFNITSQHDIFTNAIFIPVTEMLSHSKGFLNLNEKYALPFDKTQVDIIVNAGLPKTRELSDIAKNVMQKLSAIIGGEVVFENDSYFVKKSDGQLVSFSMESDGLKKFAMLWRLLENGSIEQGSILLWDEPEANINPRLIPDLVEILLELEQSGVQIFVSTHDYILAKYFEIRKKQDTQLLFHSLYKTENGAQCESNALFKDLKENPIVQAFDKLLEEVYNLDYGD